jgi:hypothetical protein
LPTATRKVKVSGLLPTVVAVVVAASKGPPVNMGLELTEKAKVESKYSSGVFPVWFTEKIHDPAPAAGKEKGTTVSFPLNVGAPHKAVMVVPPSVAVMVGRSLGAASKPTKEKVPEIKVVLVDMQAADAGALGDD